jgi:nitroreductase
MIEVDLREAMSTLRAVRRLRPDPIPEDVLRRVLEAATWAPSGGNRQPWRAVVVRERTLMKRLGDLYAEVWGAYAARYPRDGAFEKSLRAGDHLADHFADLPALVIFCFDPGQLAITDAHLGRPSVVGGASIYPAVQNLLLACRAEGLGCVLTTLLCQREPEVRAMVSIPEPWATAAAVPIGYPIGHGHGPISRRSVDDLVYGDSWGAPLATTPGT